MGGFSEGENLWSEIVQDSQFHYDVEKFYSEATGFLMTGNNLRYLIALLNSKFLTWVFKNFYSGGGLGEKGFRYKKAFLNNLPIPKIEQENEKYFTNLVNEIFGLKSKNEDTKHLESQIDNKVFELYNLTKEEVKFIENT